MTVGKLNFVKHPTSVMCLDVGDDEDERLMYGTMFTDNRTPTKINGQFFTLKRATTVSGNKHNREKKRKKSIAIYIYVQCSTNRFVMLPSTIAYRLHKKSPHHIYMIRHVVVCLHACNWFESTNVCVYS